MPAIRIRSEKRPGPWPGFVLLALASHLAGFSFRAGAAGIQESGAQPETIRVSSNLVMVPVSITDPSGRLVLDVRVEHFRVEENGIPVRVAGLGEPGETPLELALLFDVSGSMKSRFEFEQQAAVRFLASTVRPRDSVAVATIGSDPIIVHPRSSSREDALQALRSLIPTSEATAFYEAVVLAAATFARDTKDSARRVLVALSDGADNLSDRNRLPEAVRAVQQSDCVFYSINPGGRSFRMNRIAQAGQEGLEALALQTGGWAFLVDDLAELDAIFGRIAAEIRAQYLLTYYSPSPQAVRDFRSIRVQVPSRPELRIRARQGYFPRR